MKTFIRWMGNKSQHINKFKQFIPEFSGTYIEPFLGSGALFLYLKPEKWIINDLNKDLINIWINVQNNPEDIIKRFKKFGEYFKPLSKKDKLQVCKKITSKIEDMNYDIERVIIYLLMLYCSYKNIINNNKFYFSGLSLNISSNNQYYFLTNNYFNNLIEISNYLNKTNGKIYNQSYENILEKAKKGDFVFLDPPYIEKHDYQFNYNKHEQLDNTFLYKLYNEVKQLDKKNVKWLMTQSNTKEIRDVFKEYTIKTFKVYRMNKKEYVNELLIMNY